MFQEGITQFNAVLVGSVVMSLKPVFAGGDLGLMTWLLVLFGAAASVVVQTALGNILARKVTSNNAPTAGNLNIYHDLFSV